MASRKFLLLIVVALVPFAMARQDPSDKEASQVGKDLNKSIYLLTVITYIIVIDSN